MSSFNIVFLQRVLESGIVLGEPSRPVGDIFVVRRIVFDSEFPGDYWVLGVDNNEWIFVGDSPWVGDCVGVCELRGGGGPLHAAGAPDAAAAGQAPQERHGAGAAQGHRRPSGFQDRIFCKTHSNTVWAAEYDFCCKYHMISYGKFPASINIAEIST